MTVGCAGRTPTLPLSWDGASHGRNAGLERIGRDWLLVDDGLSQNGSFVNETR